MQKIMFNDRYGLTDAVIDYIKNNTRRIEGGEQFQRAATSAEDFTYEEATGCIVMCCQGIEIFRHKCRYKVGEVVAVAQSYYHAFSPRCDIPVYGADRTPGWRNKLFVRADLMPHQIRITGIKCEQLQSISHDDCFARALSNRGTNPQIPPRMGLSTRKREQPLNLTLPARPSPH